MSELVELVGQNIKDIRKSKGILQSDLAKSIGVSSTTLSKIEVGESDVRIGLLENIAKKLDVKIQKLLFPSGSVLITEEEIEKLKNID